MNPMQKKTSLILLAALSVTLLSTAFRQTHADVDTFSTDTQKIWLQLEIGLKQ